MKGKNKITWAEWKNLTIRLLTRVGQRLDPIEIGSIANFIQIVEPEDFPK